MSPFAAFTFRGVPILIRDLTTREHAEEFARYDAPRFPGCTIRRRTKTGWRTIYTEPMEEGA